MHQQPRAPARVSSPIPNTSRPGIAREAALSTRSRAGSTVSSRDAPNSPTAERPSPIGPPAESVKKLDQIIQNFYSKTAVLVLDSRVKVTASRNANGGRRANKWFQIETDEIDDFKEELKIWKSCGSLENRPPPMVIEVYLDTSRLKENQILVIVDENGKRWDVMEQLNSSGSSTDSTSRRNSEVILERWRVELKLKTTTATPTEDFGPILPTVYKKAIVFFRSLFITTRLLPGWKFASQAPAKNSHPALIPRIRIRTSEPDRPRLDQLRHPIDGRPDPVTEYMFGDLDLPVGRLSTSVTYRNDCSFRIDDSEALLSSRFMGVDENFFRPSLPQQSDRPRVPMAEVGSLRDNRSRPNVSDLQQTYGSLNTFHGNGALGTSPISALRAVRPPGSDTSSPPSSLPVNNELEGPNSLPVGRHVPTRPTVRTFDGHGRRPSVSFQPFKAGSLSGSPIPRQVEGESPASPSSFSRPGGIPSLQQARNRNSLTAGMAASLRGGPPPASEGAVPGSPKPTSASRYSSSFTHRRGRPSFGGASRAGDDEGSSGRQSLASSVAQPGSGLLAEVTGTSSDSLQGEDDISEFLKVLDSKKTLKSFEPTKRGESATNRTVAQLSRFHMMRDSNNALTDSMSSSVQMQRSSSSSSRQLTSVPGMVAPASSMSASSSPGKPLSPHTPHTPAIPSRLSENSIIDYSRGPSRQGRAPSSTATGPSRQNTITQDGTTAIDIPLSPRLESYQRRSSSAAQQNRASGDDDEAGLAFVHRSISLGANDREPPSRSILLGRHLQLDDESAAQEDIPAAEMRTAETPEMLQQGLSEDNTLDGLITVATSSSPFGRRRYMGMGTARRQTPPPSRGSFTGTAPRLPRADDESVGGEPLMFDLSEMDAQGRRSIEEGHGSSAAGPNRGGYESREVLRRGWQN